MKTFVSVIAIAFCLAASPFAVSPAAAEYLFYRNSSVLEDHWDFGTPVSRLDRYDLARELAREAEHRRIRTRLGDPDLGCRAALMDRVEIVRPGAGVVVTVCR
jgi:hypothetical protein